MGCKECGKPKRNGKCGCKSPKVLQINNPAEYITFHKVSIPAAMGDSTTNPPKIGAYRNALVYYEADHTSWMYSTDGIPTLVTGEQGPIGPQGPAGTIAIGTTTTGATGEDASVENVGTPENAILNFTIPRGEQGDQGPQGEPGPQGYMNEQDVRDVVDTIVPEGFFDDEATVSDCGTELEFENLAEGRPKTLSMKGNTTQRSYVGKNILNIVPSATSQGISKSINQDGTITVSGTCASTYVNLTARSTAISFPAGTYTISSTQSHSSFGIVLRCYAQVSGGTYTDFSIAKNSTSKTFTVNSDVKSGYIWFSGTSQGVVIDETFGIQLEAGSTATSFEPYVGGQPSPSPEFPQQIQTVTGAQTITVNNTDYTLDLGTLELCGLGDDGAGGYLYKDGIYKNPTDNKWYLQKEVGKITFTSATAWAKHSTTGGNVFLLSDTGFIGYGYNTGNAAPALMDTARVIALGSMPDSANGVFGISDSSQLRVFRGAYDASYTASTFKAEMVGHYIYGALTTPTDAEITDIALIDQLEAIRLDAGVNAVSISSDGLSGEICLEAFIGNWKGTISELKNADDRLESKIDDAYSMLPNFFLGVFFQKSTAKTGWFVSQNSVDWTPLKLTQNFASNGGRDPSIAYCKANQTFYLTHTTTVHNESITIYTSKDLRTWKTHVCPVSGMSGERTWAPDLFIEGDKLYIVVSNQYGTEPDISGSSIPAFDQYLIECTDLESLTLGQAQLINLSGAANRNHIDGSLTKLNGTYYLVVKDEYSKLTEIYSSSDLSSWNLVNANITGSSLPLEGAQLLVANDDVHFLADAFTQERYVFSRTPIQDFPAFNNAFAVTNTLVDQRHGSILFIDDIHLKKLISSVEGFSFKNSNATGKPTMNHQYITLGTGGQGHALMLNPICAIPNSYVDFAGGSANGVYDIQIANPFKLTDFKFCFGATVGATLRITHIDGTELAKPVVIKNNSLINEKMMSISIIDTYRYDICDFGTESIGLSDISDIDPRVTVNYINCIKVGSTVTMNFKLTALENIDAWIDPIFTLPSNFAAEIATMVTNDKGSNLQISSKLVGNPKINQGAAVFCSVTYACNK